MNFSSCLKITFTLYIIIGFAVTFYFTFFKDKSKYIEFTGYFHLRELLDKTYMDYLWRPNLKRNFRNSSDRIAAHLAWTKKFFENKRINNMSGKNILLVFGLEDKEFWGTDNQINCPGFSINSNKCKLTVSKNLEEKNLSPGNFDAIIYTQDYKFPRRKSLTIPEHVKQISYNEECPYMYPMKLPKNNLLVSYYRGSDIVLPYSKWVPYDYEDSKYFNVSPTPSDLLPVKDYSKGKTGLAVIFISHCGEVPSARFKYIEELKKYISVDIFGKCGVSPPCQINTTRPDECLSSVVRNYKFYLAFENSNCRDYITEKFFNNALKNDAVPVVLGAHPDDYAYAAPPNSYINTQDFQSPKDLAEYLITLDKNNTMYNEYFRWKGTGTFYHAWKDLFCRLCGLLFYADFVPPHSWKQDTTWAKVNHCLPSGQWYWNRNK